MLWQILLPEHVTVRPLSAIVDALLKSDVTKCKCHYSHWTDLTINQFAALHKLHFFTAQNPLSFKRIGVANRWLFHIKRHTGFTANLSTVSLTVATLNIVPYVLVSTGSRGLIFHSREQSTDKWLKLKSCRQEQRGLNVLNFTTVEFILCHFAYWASVSREDTFKWALKPCHHAKPQPVINDVLSSITYDW